MRYIYLVFVLVSLLFLTSTVFARTLYLRVAGDGDEGAIFVYHLKEEIPEKYRKWIIDLDTGPEGKSQVIPNLPNRVYKLDLADGKSREELKAVVLEVLQEVLKGKKSIKVKERKGRIERGNLWE